jgi:hypothetical protein
MIFSPTDQSLWSWRRSFVLVLMASAVFWGTVLYALLRF